MSATGTTVEADDVQKNEIGFRAVRRKQKSKAGRGQMDADTVIDTMKDDWDGLQEELLQLPEDEQEKMKTHFNELIDDYDTLGDILYGDIGTFNDTIANMEDPAKKTYADEIVRVELLDSQN